MRDGHRGAGEKDTRVKEKTEAEEERREEGERGQEQRKRGQEERKRGQEKRRGSRTHQPTVSVLPYFERDLFLLIVTEDCGRL